MFKKIVRHDDNLNFRDLLFQAQEFSEDRKQQIDYMKNKGTSQQYLLGLLTLTQIELANNPSLRTKDITLPQGTVEYLLRGILDAARHMQKDLPEGVYDTILGNLEPGILRSLSENTQLKKNK